MASKKRHDSGLHGSAASPFTLVACPQCTPDDAGRMPDFAPGVGVRCRLCNFTRGHDEIGMVLPFVRRIFRHWLATNTEHRQANPKE